MATPPPIPPRDPSFFEKTHEDHVKQPIRKAGQTVYRGAAKFVGWGCGVLLFAVVAAVVIIPGYFLLRRPIAKAIGSVSNFFSSSSDTPPVSPPVSAKAQGEVTKLEEKIKKLEDDMKKGASAVTKSSTRKNKTATKEDPTPYIGNAERHLANLHYYTGKVDGLDTRELHNAIEKFQRDHGLNATGKLTPNTYKAILETDGVKVHEAVVAPPANPPVLPPAPAATIATPSSKAAPEPSASVVPAVISRLNINVPSLNKNFCEGDVRNTAGDRVLLIDVEGKNRDRATLRFPDGRTVRVDVKKDGSVSFKNKGDEKSLSAEQKASVKGAAVGAQKDCEAGWIQKRNGAKATKVGAGFQVGGYTITDETFKAVAPYVEVYSYYGPIWGGGAGRSLFTIGGGHRGGPAPGGHGGGPH